MLFISGTRPELSDKLFRILNQASIWKHVLGVPVFLAKSQLVVPRRTVVPVTHRRRHRIRTLAARPRRHQHRLRDGTEHLQHDHPLLFRKNPCFTRFRRRRGGHTAGSRNCRQRDVRRENCGISERSDRREAEPDQQCPASLQQQQWHHRLPYAGRHPVTRRPVPVWWVSLHQSFHSPQATRAR